jgi:hypothetical protein
MFNEVTIIVLAVIAAFKSIFIAVSEDAYLIHKHVSVSANFT